MMGRCPLSAALCKAVWEVLLWGQYKLAKTDFSFLVLEVGHGATVLYHCTLHALEPT